MSRIILHIGTHKTATTTLQQTFHSNRAELERHGIVYPDVPPSTGHHILGAEWIDPILPPSFSFSMPEGGPARMWKHISDQHAASDRTVLISAEAFSRGAPKRVDMKAFRKHVSSFDEIQVVCVLRDQISYLQSLYMQISKDWNVPAFVQFFNGALNTGMAAGVWLDFGALYDHILTGFPADEVRFVNYDELRSHPDGVIGGMLARIPGSPPASALTPVNGGKSNVSADPLGVWSASRISAPHKPSPQLVQLAMVNVREEFGTSRSMIYTPQEINQLQAHFAPLNRQFEERVRFVQPDYQHPPLRLPEKWVGRHQIKDTFWLKMARQLYSSQND